MEVLRARNSVNKDRKPYESVNVYNSCNKQLKIIKFTGNLKENIDELIGGMECKCGLKKDFYQIINAYGEKIIKLREERAKYRESWTQEKLQNQCLQNSLKNTLGDLRRLQDSISKKQNVSKLEYEKLVKEKTQFKKKYEQTKFEQEALHKQYQQMQKQLKKLNEIITNFTRKPTQDSYLLDDSILETNIPSFKQLQQLSKDFNLKNDEIIRILKEYVSQIPNFETKQERDLFNIAIKMNKNLWAKKIEIEIKELQHKKQQLKKWEDQLKRKQK